MNPEQKKTLYKHLSQPFPEEAIERTDGRVTGKGYSTTGIKAQFVINRLNEVLGIGGWRTHRKINVRELTTNSDRKAYEAVCDLVLELGEWIDGTFVTFAEALADGGHVSTSEADARKGSFSNALKKAAAAFGAGRQAYEGTIDDDNVPQDEHHQPGPQEAPRPVAHHPGPPRPAASVAPPLPSTPRNRLTSKQLAALLAISRKLGMDLAQFRQQVRSRFGTQVEFITKAQASELIGELGNGGLHHQGDGEVELAEPGAEG
jgi:hypothetical protein